MIKYFDIFAGIGGFRSGLEKAGGFQCVGYCEIDKYAKKAYETLYDTENEVYYDDARKIDPNELPDLDLICGGFPCQSFSIAGKRGGFDDARGTLFFEIARIAAVKKPKYLLLENVPGLLSHDQGRTFATILGTLDELGYDVVWEVLNSANFRVAQSRKRVYIVGTLTDKVSLDDFDESIKTLDSVLEQGLPTVDSDFTRKLFTYYTPEEVKGKSIKDKRGGKNNIHSWDIDLKGVTTPEEKEFLSLLLKERRKKHWAEEIGITWMDGMPLTEEQIRTFYDVPELHEMLNHLHEMGYLAFEHPKKQIEKDGTKVRVPDTDLPKGYNIVAGKLSFEFSKILSPDEMAPTLVAMDVSKLGVVDGNGIRRLSIRECQRLCGYPDEYSLDQLSEGDAFDLLGNTVCVPVIKEISLRLGEIYQKQR